jgi:hypothetical protein
VEQTAGFPLLALVTRRFMALSITTRLGMLVLAFDMSVSHIKEFSMKESDYRLVLRVAIGLLIAGICYGMIHGESLEAISNFVIDVLQFYLNLLTIAPHSNNPRS